MPLTVNTFFHSIPEPLHFQVVFPMACLLLEISSYSCATNTGLCPTFVRPLSWTRNSGPECEISLPHPKIGSTQTMAPVVGPSPVGTRAPEPIARVADLN